MKESSTEEKREDLINELSFLGKISDDLWKYHPENPERTDVTTSFDKVKKMMDKIEAQLAEL
ncbi:hypothetical protein PQZ39_00115 [bacterium]|nr:hypothetical protein [bacterium]